MELKPIIESILFASQKPMNLRELRDVLTGAADKSEDEAVKAHRKTPEEPVLEALNALEKEHAAAGRSFQLVCVAGSWQFVSKPEFSPWLRAMLGEKNRPTRLSQPALETLAIIAYREPITRAEIEQIRGVAVDGVVATLVERGLIESAGRAEVIGRPMMYKTASAFLEYFGLKGLEQLPAADELRRIPVVKPEALLTVDPGLATAPPDELTPAVESTSSAEPVSAEPAPTSPGDTAEPLPQNAEQAS